MIERNVNGTTGLFSSIIWTKAISTLTGVDNPENTNVEPLVPYPPFLLADEGRFVIVGRFAGVFCVCIVREPRAFQVWLLRQPVRIDLL
jgi:hypothetical protein